MEPSLITSTSSSMNIQGSYLLVSSIRKSYWWGAQATFSAIRVNTKATVQHKTLELANNATHKHTSSWKLNGVVSKGFNLRLKQSYRTLKEDNGVRHVLSNAPNESKHSIQFTSRPFISCLVFHFCVYEKQREESRNLLLAAPRADEFRPSSHPCVPSFSDHLF